MWETLAPALAFSWEGKPELEGKRVWQLRAPTNSINYNQQNGHPQLPDCQLADCHVTLGREEKHSEHYKLICIYGNSLWSTQKSPKCLLFVTQWNWFRK